MKNILLLGSKSKSRQMLLNEAQIPFILIDQYADEAQCDWGMPLQKVVESIALHKMEHLNLPEGKEGDYAFVLTADTLSQDSHGAVHGKPKDYIDAVKKIKRAQNGSRLCTAFCLDKRIFKDGKWHIEKRIQDSVRAKFLFEVPDHLIDDYLKHSIGLECSGAIAIEQYGLRYLKWVDGSYSAIVGLPIYQVRQALTELGFFN